MARLYLPIGRRPFSNPQNEREELLNELWDLRVSLPGAGQMETEFIRDVVQRARTKHKEEVARELAAAPVKRLSDEQVAIGLREYIAQRDARLGGRKVYY